MMESSYIDFFKLRIKSEYENLQLLLSTSISVLTVF